MAVAKLGQSPPVLDALPNHRWLIKMLQRARTIFSSAGSSRHIQRLLLLMAARHSPRMRQSLPKGNTTMDPPPGALAADAHRCIMVLGPEWTTEYKVVGAGFRRAAERVGLRGLTAPPRRNACIDVVNGVALMFILQPGFEENRQRWWTGNAHD